MLDLFWPGTGLEKILWMHAWIEDNFWRKSFSCGNLSWLAPYFWLFQWCLSTPYASCPMKLHGWSSPFSGPACQTIVCLHVLPTAWLFETYLTAFLYIQSVQDIIKVLQLESSYLIQLLHFFKCTEAQICCRTHFRLLSGRQPYFNRMNALCLRWKTY
jgi:hypothetical protein